MTAGRLHAFILLTLTISFTSAGFGDIVTQWNQQANECVLEAKTYPFVGTRVMAIVHTSMFDAINSIEGHYTPYRFKVSAPPGRSAEVAGATAAHTTLLALFPEQKTALNKAYADSLGKVADGPGKSTGIQVGEEVAAKVLAWRASDGADAGNIYRPPTAPGAFVSTALPVGTQWGNVAPWVMERGSQFHPVPPPTLSSAEWAGDYNEIKELGAKKSSRRSDEQTEIARFWSITGPQSFDPIVRQLADTPGRSLSQNARLFALAEIAVADSYIAVFEAKYAYNFWRPITAIRNGDIDNNDGTVRDPAWEPLIDTPLHPEYPCAHCINSAAARAVLESEFGTGPNPLSMSSPAVPGVVHKWATIADYAEEVSAARIYGGLHYRNSTLVGKAMGKKIADLAVQKYLKPVH